MSAFVYGGDDEFDALAFGRPHPNTIAFLNGQQANRQPSRLNAAAQRFTETVSAVYKRYNDSDAVRIARAAARKVMHLWQTDVIKPLITIGDFQQAPLTMQRWNMAEPTIRKMYHAQQCDGYSESYVDVDPTHIAESHYDYRRATHGVWFRKDDTQPLGATTYYDDLREGDSKLYLTEQADIHRSWCKLREHIKAYGEDPTSKFNSQL